MALTHRHKPAEWSARKAAVASAKSEHGQGHNVPALRSRIDTLEIAVGVMKPT